MRKSKNIWMLVDLRNDEIPLEIADTARELAEKCGVKERSIIESVSRAKRLGIRCRYVKVELNEKSSICTCWHTYPNLLCKKDNGNWKCMNYRCIKKPEYKTVGNSNRVIVKTVCTKKEGAENDRIRESNITHKDKSGCVGGTGSREGTITRAV